MKTYSTRIIVLAFWGVFTATTALYAHAYAADASALNYTDDGFLLLAGGSFMMGSPKSERQRGLDEIQHEVSISTFYVDPCEVTQADYEALMGENPSAHKGKRLPVENVTWLDAVRYCNALSAQAGLEPVYIIEGEAVRWNRRYEGTASTALDVHQHEREIFCRGRDFMVEPRGINLYHAGNGSTTLSVP